MNIFYHMFRYGMLVAFIYVIASTAVNAQESFNMEKRGLPIEGVTLTAILQQNAVSTGDQAMMFLTLRNESRESRYFDFSGVAFDYSVIVQDSKGQILQQNKHPYPSLLTATIVGPALLDPHAESSTIYPLSFAFDITKVGIYRITAMSKISTSVDLIKHYDVVSNTVILTVTEHLAKDITLTSVLTKPSVATDKPIVMALKLKNTAKKPKTLTAKDLSEGYTFTVQDFRGEIIQPTYKEKVAVDEKSSDRVLQPDETIVTNIDMEKMYDLHKEGRYFITASHNITDDKGQLTQVYSNTAVLTVSKTPPPDAGYHDPTTNPER